MSKNKVRVVGDLEADGLLDEATRIHCAVFKCLDTGRKKKFTPENVHLIPKFLDKVDVLVMHNGISYDLPLLEKLYGYEYKGQVVDTLVMSQTMRIGLTKPKGHGNIGPHSIEAYGIRYGRYKPENEDWSEYTDHMLHRCDEDVEITHLVYKDLMENEYTPDWKKALAITHKFFDLTSKMERFGWLFDDKKAKRLIKILGYLIERIDRVVHRDFPPRLVRKYKEPLNKPFKKNGTLSKAALDWLEKYGTAYAEEDIAGPFSRIGWEPFNLGSVAQVSGYLLEDGWIPKEWNYKKDPKTKREMLDDNGERIKTSPKLSQDDPFEGVKSPYGKKLAARVQLSHRKSYLEGLLKNQRPDGRIGCSVAGLAKTYRVRHRGIVNTPNDGAFLGKHIRSLFICPDDRILVSVDATSCQVRMEGAYAKDEAYAKMLLNEDTHTIVMNAVNRVMKRLRKPEISRSVAKNFNFALKFGAQDPKLGKMAGLGEREGSMIRASINQEFGAQDALIKRLQKEWRKNAKAVRKPWGVKYEKGYIKGLDGRPVYVDAEYKCLVYAMQSAETIFMQAAFVFYHQLLTQHGFKHGKDYGFVAHYHDEYTVEVFNPDNAELFKQLGEEAMTKASNYFNLFVPQQGDGAIGKSWLEVHSPWWVGAIALFQSMLDFLPI